MMIFHANRLQVRLAPTPIPSSHLAGLTCLSHPLPKRPNISRYLVFIHISLLIVIQQKKKNDPDPLHFPLKWRVPILRTRSI